MIYCNLFYTFLYTEYLFSETFAIEASFDVDVSNLNLTENSNDYLALMIDLEGQLFIKMKPKIRGLESLKITNLRYVLEIILE